MKPGSVAAVAALALALALGFTARVHSQYRAFRDVVNSSLATTEGYDQKFIDLVNHLEDILTARASFPFLGGKDPMTGRRREVVAPAPAQPPRPAAAARAAQARSPRPKVPAPDTVPAPPVDRVRLTAIIADDYGQHTAIVMDGERSLSVDVGDVVGGRRVVRITGRELTMEDDASVYTYSLAGARSQQRK